MEVEINIEEIQEFLPHRYPMLLVDRVTEIVLGDRIVAYKNITTNEPFFMGHFPGKQVMPGVLIVEAMAQASGILGFKTMNKKPEDGSIYYFVGADDLRFKRPAIPGDKLILNSSLICFTVDTPAAMADTGGLPPTCCGFAGGGSSSSRRSVGRQQ